MPDLFLLGAGASVEAGIPDSYRMTNKMLENFSEDFQATDQQYDKVLQFVIGGLSFQQGIKGENPLAGVNIEDLFNALIQLSNRHNSELSPFINTWHPHLIGLENGKMDFFMSRELLETINNPIEKFIGENNEKLLEQVADLVAHRSSSSFRKRKIDTFIASNDFETIFTDAVRKIVFGSEGKLLKDTADAMIQHLVKMVWIKEPERINYLIPLINYANTNKAFVVTLNYDNTIELACKNHGIEIDIGFDSWSNSGEFKFIDGKIPLLKLHGSIDWALSIGKIGQEKPLPYQIINKVDPNLENQRHFKPAIIFGGKNKLTAKGPFLSLLHSFEEQLSKSSNLIIIGYSFGDEHVNEYITNWFNGDVTRKISIINPNFKSLKNEFTRLISNNSVKERVNIIEEKTSNGILKIGEIN